MNVTDRQQSSRACDPCTHARTCTRIHTHAHHTAQGMSAQVWQVSAGATNICGKCRQMPANNMGRVSAKYARIPQSKPCHILLGTQYSHFKTTSASQAFFLGYPPPQGNLCYGTYAQEAISTKRRKKMGLSVAYKTIGAFPSHAVKPPTDPEERSSSSVRHACVHPGGVCPSGAVVLPRGKWRQHYTLTRKPIPVIPNCPTSPGCSAPTAPLHLLASPCPSPFPTRTQSAGLSILSAVGQDVIAVEQLWLSALGVILHLQHPLRRGMCVEGHAQEQSLRHITVSPLYPPPPLYKLRSEACKHKRVFRYHLWFGTNFNNGGRWRQ